MWRAARLRTLTDHPRLDLIIVLNSVGDGAEAFPSAWWWKYRAFKRREARGDRSDCAHGTVPSRGARDRKGRRGRQPDPGCTQEVRGGHRGGTCRTHRTISPHRWRPPRHRPRQRVRKDEDPAKRWSAA